MSNDTKKKADTCTHTDKTNAQARF